VFSSARRQQYSAILLYGANVALIFSLLLLRSSRIRGNATPYFTAEFILLLVSALLLAGVSTWVIYRGRLQKRLMPRFRWWALAAWIIVGAGVLVAAPSLLALLQPYLPPFFLWWLLTGVGIGIIAWGNNERQSDAPPKPKDNLIAIGFGVLLVVFVLEIGMRVWFTYFGSELERALYIYSSKEIASRGQLVGAPYINFMPSPDYPSHNRLGYRGRDIAIPKPDGVFRIVAMGGSTTYGISLEWAEAYPAQLETILREEYGYSNVEVVNAGAVAYASWETLVNFEFRVLDLDPDMLLVYDGINDVYARLVDPQFYNGGNPARGIWESNPAPLPPITLYRFIAVNLRLLNPIALEQNLANRPNMRCDIGKSCSNLNMTPEEVLATNPPIYFERNLRSLVVLADLYDVQLVFSSWAYFPDPLEDYILPIMTYPYMQQAVDEQNNILKQISDETDAKFYNLMANLPHEKAYWLDGIHFSATGSHEQAKLYAAFLVENNLIPKPSESP
jgi:hypothetical protein